MKAAPFSSPQSRAALEPFKAIVREHVPARLIEAVALHVAGEPQERQDAGIGQACNEMLSSFAKEGASESMSYAFTAAFVHLVRERIMEIEAQGSGRA